MISTTPSVAEVDATINLLSILEMAKDAGKLKAALAEIKQAHDAVKADLKAAQEAKADAGAAQELVSREKARVDADLEKLRVQQQSQMRTAEAIEADRAALRADREKFDAWAAKEREQLAEFRARAASDIDQVARHTNELGKAREELLKMEAAAVAAERAADARRAEYENKIASLKAMVG